jgi:ADP-ribosylglycohydrolase
MHSFGALNATSLREESERAARLTHGGPAAFNAVTAVAFATRLAARGEPRDSWARETASFLGGGQLAEKLSALDSMREESDLASQLREIGTGLDAVQSVTASLAIAMHPGSFSEAVLTAVQAGGATDTVAAMTGAFVGAADGIGAIPQPLIDGLQGRIYISLAAPWFFKAARQYAGHLIDLRPVHGPRPNMPPRQ